MLIIVRKNLRRVPASALLPQQVLDWVGHDSATSRNFLHELIQFEKRAYDYQTAGIFYSSMFNTKPIVKGNDFIGWKSRTLTGGADFISRRETNFPLSDAGMSMNYDGIAPIGSAYAIDYFEQNTAQMLGQNLDEDGMQAARQLIDFKIDEGLHFGGRTPDGIGVRGIFNYMNGGDADNGSIPKFDLPATGTGSSRKFKDKDGAEILRNAKAFLNSIDRNSRRSCRVSKLVMGEDAYEQFITKTVTGEGGDGTVLVERALLKSRPDLQIIVNPFFDGLGGTANPYDGSPEEDWTDVTGDGVMLAYDDSDRTHQAPVLPFEVLRPYEHQGLITKVNCLGLMSSLQIKLFPAFAYAKGVS